MHPNNFFGRLVKEAKVVIEREEVFEAMMQCAGATASTSLNSLDFNV